MRTVLVTLYCDIILPFSILIISTPYCQATCYHTNLLIQNSTVNIGNIKYYRHIFLIFELRMIKNMGLKIFLGNFCLEHTYEDVMQGKLSQWCTHLLYCSVLSLGGKVKTRRMLQPDMGSIFHIKKSMKYSGHRKLLCELSKLSNFMFLTSSDTKRKLMHLFILLFKFRPKRTGFNMYVEYLRPQSTFLSLYPLHALMLK